MPATWKCKVGTPAVALAAAIVFVLAGAAAAQPETRATISAGESRVVTIASESAPAAVPSGTLLLAIDVFRPSRGASSQVVLRTADGGIEIGRVGIFPNEAITPDRAPIRAILALPPRLRLDPGDRIMVSLEPVGQASAGAGAMVSIGGIFLR